MNNIQLGDFLGVYPDFEITEEINGKVIKSIQREIYKKEEFRTLTTTSSDKEKIGPNYKHQEVVARLLSRITDELFVHQGTGTGKTCSATITAEFFKAIFDQEKNNPNFKFEIKKCIILTKGEALQNEFRKLLIDSCTQGKYLNLISSTDSRINETSINYVKTIDEFYEFSTYITFTNMLIKMSQQEVLEKYENTLFVIDEIHNLIQNDQLFSFDEDNEETIDTGIDLELNTIGTTYRKVYETLNNLFHNLKVRKILLMSATPMINSPEDFISVMNLILPLDKPLLTEDIYDVEKLNEKIYGRYIYFRELDSIAKGVNINNERRNFSQLAYFLDMSDYQKKVYDDESLIRSRGNLKRLHKICVFTFPTLQNEELNIASSNLTFKKYITFSPDGLTYFWNFENPDIEKIKNDLSTNLKKYSPKFDLIVNNISEKEGKIAIHCEYVSFGVIILGLLYELKGYVKFDPYLDNIETLDKRPRYCIIAGQRFGKAETTTNTLNAYNHKKNILGEYIKVIIGSPVTQDGINYTDIQHMILVSPKWNEARSFQALSRSLRATSHENLIQYLENRGETNFKIDVNIYRLCMLRTSEETMVTNEDFPFIPISELSDFDKIKTVDYVMFEKSEEKDIKIKSVEHNLKQVAVDCHINIFHNERSLNPDDFSYSCFTSRPDTVDYSTYKLYYSQDKIEIVKGYIKNIFLVKESFTTDEIFSKLNIEPYFIIVTLNELLENKFTFKDRFGFDYYLRNIGNTFFFQREQPLNINEQSNHLKSYYVSGIYSYFHREISEINIDEIYEKEINELKLIEPGTFEFKETLINNLSLNSKVRIFETSFMNYIEKKGNDRFSLYVLHAFDNAFFKFKEPVKRINEHRENMEKRNIGRGRRSLNVLSPKLQVHLEENLTENYEESLRWQTGEKVYVHIIDILYNDVNNRKINSKINKINGIYRIYKESEKIGWRNAQTYEIEVYHDLIQFYRNNANQTVLKNNIYGNVLLRNNTFRIIDKSQQFETNSVIPFNELVEESLTGKITKSRNGSLEKMKSEIKKIYPTFEKQIDELEKSKIVYIYNKLEEKTKDRRLMKQNGKKCENFPKINLINILIDEGVTGDATIPPIQVITGFLQSEGIKISNLSNDELIRIFLIKILSRADEYRRYISTNDVSTESLIKYHSFINYSKHKLCQLIYTEFQKKNKLVFY